jgi:ribosomal protein L11 methyltransferase
MTLWNLTAILPRETALGVEPRLAEAALSVSTLLVEGEPDRLQLDVLFDGEPSDEDLAGLGGLAFELGPLEDRDWVRESQRQLPPVTAGRFHVHGGHDPAHPAPHMHDMTIEAGRAFGTGLHETTKGCLLLLDRVVKTQGRNVRRILDLGCGSGILAIAAAKALHRPVLAADIDSQAVEETRSNARANGERKHVEAFAANGLEHARIGQGGKYDLVLANILAKPLADMAPAMTRATAPGSLLILSGLLETQRRPVERAYRLSGFCVVRRLSIGNWCSLLLCRGT